MTEEKGYSTPMAPSLNDSASCILIQGWLHKKSRYLRRWRNRWMVMTQKTLCSYKNANDFKNATETVFLHQLISISIDKDSFDINKNSKLNQKYIFELTVNLDKESPLTKQGENDDNNNNSTNNNEKNIRIFTFSAQNEKECHAWIDQFERILTINKTLVILPSKVINTKCSLSHSHKHNHKHSHKHNHKHKHRHHKKHSNNGITKGSLLGDSNNDLIGGKSNNNNGNNNDSFTSSTSSDGEINTDIANYGCQHYRRNCYVKSKCCNHWYFCSYCHDAHEDTLDIGNILKSLRNDTTNGGGINGGGGTQIESHTLDRQEIDSMTCMECGKEQIPSNYCINPKCRIRMAKYYCDKCKFWNNDPNCQLFHCDGCGVCRTGNREDYKHCNKCGVCLTKAYYARHKCIEQATQCDCPICGDFLHRSDKPVTFWPNCGHGIHVECMNEYLKFDSLCSVCRTPWVPDLTNLNINYINTY